MYISKLDVNVTLSFPQKVTFCLSIAVRAWATFAVTTTTIITEIKVVWVSFVNKLNVKYVLVLTKYVKYVVI